MTRRKARPARRKKKPVEKMSTPELMQEAARLLRLNQRRLTAVERQAAVLTELFVGRTKVEKRKKGAR